MTPDCAVRRLRRPNPTNPKAWKERARIATSELAHAKHGRRETALVETFDGTHVNTVRREIKALSFLDGLEKSEPELFGRLQTVPFNSIEIPARWYDFDPTGSVEAARKRASGEYSSSSLQSAMTLAKAVFCGPSRKDLPNHVRSSLAGP